MITFGGALVSAWLVAKFAPEAEGHGTDSAIEAVHTDPRAIRARAVLVKMVSSALTIGSGGSAGREGPTAQISAGFGSLLTRRLDLSDEDGRVAVSLGIGSGIGAIFGAPLGGAVLAASIVYREDFDYRSLIPGFITSGTAYAIYGSILGFEPLFGFVAADYQFDPADLLWFLVIGIVAAAIGYLYARMFYATVALTHRLPGGSVLKPAVGGLLVGLLALLIPQILSSGYGWVQLASAKDTLMTIPLWIVLILPIAKIVATSLSIGTGGSGGIFGPGIVIGAFVGAAIWRLADLAGAPGIPGRPRGFRRRGDDGVLRQRGPRTAGRDDHGRRDDRLVLGRAGRDDRRRDRLSAHHPHRRVDLSGAATQPGSRRGRAQTRRGGGLTLPTSTSVWRRTTQDVNSRNTSSARAGERPACYFTGAFFFAARAAPFSVVAPLLAS